MQMLPLFTSIQMFVLYCAYMSTGVQLPLSAALWPDYHEWLPVLSGEPWGEAVKTSLHVWSLNNR